MTDLERHQRIIDALEAANVGGQWPSSMLHEEIAQDADAILLALWRCADTGTRSSLAFTHYLWQMGQGAGGDHA